MRENLQDVITAAVADVTEHGYDNPERIAAWMTRIRQAATASLVPEHELAQVLQSTMRAIYTRLVERGRISKFHPGAARFTIDKVRPQLRAELDRRILASANLIKLNRAEAIEKTLRRFSGWATSVPVGGSGAVDRRDVKDNIRKSLTQLPFEERRVLIDQGHKFTSALNETIATGGGAIACVWRSRWRQAGYDYREDHKERDGLVYAIRGNWAIERGLMKLSPNGYVDQITKPGEEVFCRCSYEYIYNLRDLPTEMLTTKGKAELARVRVA